MLDYESKCKRQDRECGVQSRSDFVQLMSWLKPRPTKNLEFSYAFPKTDRAPASVEMEFGGYSESKPTWRMAVSAPVESEAWKSRR
jgi:hypothetical protein